MGRTLEVRGDTDDDIINGKVVGIFCNFANALALAKYRKTELRGGPPRELEKQDMGLTAGKIGCLAAHLIWSCYVFWVSLLIIIPKSVGMCLAVDGLLGGSVIVECVR